MVCRFTTVSFSSSPFGDPSSGPSFLVLLLCLFFLFGHSWQGHAETSWRCRARAEQSIWHPTTTCVSPLANRCSWHDSLWQSPSRDPEPVWPGVARPWLRVLEVSGHDSAGGFAPARCREFCACVAAHRGACLLVPFVSRSPDRMRALHPRLGSHTAASRADVAATAAAVAGNAGLASGMPQAAHLPSAAWQAAATQHRWALQATLTPALAPNLATRKADHRLNPSPQRPPTTGDVRTPPAIWAAHRRTLVHVTVQSGPTRCAQKPEV